MAISGKHLIAGQWQRANTPSFSSVDPRSKQSSASIFADATEAEINAALEAASLAFAETRNYPTEKLAQFLDTVATEIEALGDELLTTADMETGLGLPRLTGERGRTTNQLRSFAAHIREGSFVEAIIDTALPDRKPAPRHDIRRMLVPIGTVAVFSPNNFPLAFGVAGGDTASAFAAGCPVIAKGHPSHPATSELVSQAIHSAIEKCGFPKGFYSLIQGAGIEVGQNLVKHPQLAAVGFTGSLRGGRAVFDTAAQRPKPIPVYAEMGSINPVVILPDAISSRQNLASEIAGSITLGSGQFCTNPGLIILLDSAETDKFIADVANLMESQAPTVLLNEGVLKSLEQGVSRTKNKAPVNILTGGEVVSSDGFCYRNTLMRTSAEAFIQDHDLQAEHFGPVSLFVTCKSLAELEAVIEALEGNLTATIYATEQELAISQNLFNSLREKVGRLIFNAVPTGVEVVHAMQHGGPYPASTAAATSVGMTAIKRFLRPVAYQNMPNTLLPDALKNENPLGIWRIVDNQHSQEPIA